MPDLWVIESLTGWVRRDEAHVRYRDVGGGVRLVHTLNNTAIATPRIIVALLENLQMPDGRMRLAQALRPYFGGDCYL